jgi:hypothetical protein
MCFHGSTGVSSEKPSKTEVASRFQALVNA